MHHNTDEFSLSPLKIVHIRNIKLLLQVARDHLFNPVPAVNAVVSGHMTSCDRITETVDSLCLRLSAIAAGTRSHGVMRCCTKIQRGQTEAATVYFSCPALPLMHRHEIHGDLLTPLPQREHVSQKC